MFKINSEKKVLLGILAGAFLVISFLCPKTFLTAGTFQGMAFQLPELGMLSMAMMISMLTGGINLSIVSTANMAAISAALVLCKFVNPEAPVSGDALYIILAVGIAVAVSALIGLVNGFLVAIIDIPPILATLGSMKLLQGLAFILTKGYVLSGMPSGIVFIGNGSIAGIPFPLILFAIFAAIFSVYLKQTPAGFSTFLLGSNPVATSFSGISNTKTIILTYLLSGLYSGVAGIIMMSRFNSAKAGYGESYLLVTVLACVLGGVKSDGGFGDVGGLVLSLVILQMLSSGLNLLGVSSFLTIALWGAIMIAVMLMQFAFGRKRHLAV
jgi:simple sugar transport system permease protein